MILFPHMLIGGAIGVHSKNICWAFLFGFLSHFVLDMIPHWEYLDHLKQVGYPKNFPKIFIDFAVGISAVMLLTWSFPNKLVILSAVAGSIIPDALQIMIHFFKLNWLKPLFDFHRKIHSDKELSFWQGIPVFLLIIFLTLLILKL